MASSNAKYDSQQLQNYLENPFIAGGPEGGGVKTIKTLKNILKLNKREKADLTPRASGARTTSRGRKFRVKPGMATLGEASTMQVDGS